MDLPFEAHEKLKNAAILASSIEHKGADEVALSTNLVKAMVLIDAANEPIEKRAERIAREFPNERIKALKALSAEMGCDLKTANDALYPHYKEKTQNEDNVCPHCGKICTNGLVICQHCGANRLR